MSTFAGKSQVTRKNNLKSEMGMTFLQRRRSYQAKVTKTLKKKSSWIGEKIIKTPGTGQNPRLRKEGKTHKI